MVQGRFIEGRPMKFKSDIDIDFADRTQILSKIKHIPASIIKDNTLTKHNTGVYVTDIPVDPFTEQSSLDYQKAEERGYIKLDFLNVNLYSKISNESHLQKLLDQEPAWDMLYERAFCEQLIHIGGHYDTLILMPEAITSINKMSMFLSVIRPAKRHLIGLPWQIVEQTIWEKTEGSYSFKRSHAVAYAHLVVVNMNLLSNSAD